MLHTPTTRLRDAAADQSLEGPGFPELAVAIERLFALSEDVDEAADSGGGDLARASEPTSDATDAAEPSGPLATESGMAKVGSR
jgi:hypothetical protein